MKFRSLVSLFTLLALMGTACGTDDREDSSVADGDADLADAAETSDETYDLQVATYIPEAGPLGETLAWWMEEIEARSDGRVQFEAHYSEALLSGTDLRDGIAGGRTDVGLLSPSTYHVEQFPLVDGLTLVPGVPNPVAFGNALHELYRSDPRAQAEYEDQGLVGLSWLPLVGMMGTPEPIEGPDDLAGLDIRGNRGAGIDRHLELAGANSIALPLLELYEALARGVADGFWGLGIDVAQSINMQEVSPYWTDPEIGVFATATIAIQKARFEELPGDIQDIFTEVGREAQDHYAGLIEDITRAACDGLDDEGVTLYALPESAAIDDWKAEARDIQVEEWGSLAEAAGVDPDEHYARFLELYEAEAEAVDVVTVASCL